VGVDPREAEVMDWIFLVLAVLTAGAAASARTRARTRWGRTDTAVPMSITGLLAWAGAVLLLSAAAFGIAPLWTIFLVVPLLAIAGMYDSHRHGKRQASKQGRGARPRPGDRG